MAKLVRQGLRWVNFQPAGWVNFTPALTTEDMIREAKAAGTYQNELLPAPVDRIQIVTIREIVEDGKRLALPLSMEVLKDAKAAERARDGSVPLFDLDDLPLSALVVEDDG